MVLSARIIRGLHGVAAAFNADAAGDGEGPVIIDIHKAGLDAGAETESIAILNAGEIRLVAGVIVEPAEAKKGRRHGDTRKSIKVLVQGTAELQPQGGGYIAGAAPEKDGAGRETCIFLQLPFLASETAVVRWNGKGPPWHIARLVDGQDCLRPCGQKRYRG